MSEKIFSPKAIAVVCSSLLSTMAMAAGTADHNYVNTDTREDGYSIKNETGGHFDNQGTINAVGSNDVHGVKLDKSQFDQVINSGTMTGLWNGISIESGSKVGEVINSNQLTAQKQHGIYVAQSGTDVNKITNTGTITGHNGIWVDAGAHVGTIDVGGKVNAQGTGVRVVKSNVDTIHVTGQVTSAQYGMSFDDATIGKVVLDKGAVASTGNTTGSYAASGIRIAGSHLDQFINNGQVSGAYGMHFQNGKVDEFVNNGTITGKFDGIKFANWYGQSVVKKFTNTGTIQANNGLGLYFESNSKIDELINSGRIVGTTAGISNIASWKEVPAHIGTITVQNKGSIEATNGNGIQLVKQGPNFVSIDSITVDNGGKIEGTKSGIWFANNTGAKAITNNGLIQGSSGIWNDGIVGAEGTGYGINVGSTGQIVGTGNVGIGNTGKIIGGIQVAGVVKGERDGIRNSGTLVAAKGQNALNINNGAVNTITNSGTIDGNVNQTAIHGVKISGSKAVVGQLTNTETGTISGLWNGISVESGAQVGAITNAGKLNASYQFGVYVNGKDTLASTITNAATGQILASQGIVVNGGANVMKVANLGTIKANYTGLTFAGVNVGEITNSGLVQGQHNAMNLDHATVGTVRVEKSGSLVATGTNFSSYGDFGVRVTGSKVTNFMNAGTIKGANGITLQNSTIQTFTNSGTIGGTANAGLYLATWQNTSTIERLVNTGTIQSYWTGHGITLEPTTSIKVLENSGKIIGRVSGIGNQVGGGQLGQVIIKKGGLIEGQTANGIEIKNSPATKASLASLVVEDGGELKAKQSGLWFARNTQAGTISVAGKVNVGGVALYNEGVMRATESNPYVVDFAKNAQVTVGSGQAVLRNVQSGQMLGSIRLANNLDTAGVTLLNEGVIKGSSAAEGAVAIYGNVGKIQNRKTITADAGAGIVVGQGGRVAAIDNTGAITGATDGLLISGTVGADGNKAVAINIAKGSTLTGNTGYAFNNAGTINGDVTINGTLKGGKGEVHNSGTINGAFTMNYQGDQRLDLGKITGKVTLNGKDAVSIQNVGLTKTDKLNIEAANAKSVQLENVTLSSSDLAASLANSNVGVSLSNLVAVNGQAIDAKSVSLDGDLADLGFKTTFDEANQKIDARVEGASTTGGILGQLVANQSMRRDFFVDSMVNEAVQSAQYNSKADNSLASIFVKPYGSSDQHKAGGASLEGNTYGLLLGANYVNDGVGLTAYAGYEQADLDNDALSVSSDTFYAGATGFGTVAKFGNADLFVKTGVKASMTRNDLTRTITSTTSQTKVNGVNWSANAQVGLNYNVAPASTITPTVGVGFASSNLNDFSLAHDGGASVDRYSLNNVTMPYGEVAVHWQQGWLDNLRTNIGAGVRVLFDKSQALTSSYNGTAVQSDYNLSGSYEYVSADVAWKLNRHNEVTMGYTGVFEDHGQSHNVTAKYEYLF